MLSGEDSGIIILYSNTLGIKKMNELNLIGIEDIQFMCDNSDPAAQDMFSVTEHDLVIDDHDIDSLWSK